MNLEFANAAWLGAEPVIEEAQMAETIETELLVCGGGVSGLTAWAYACDQGVKALLIEKSGKLITMRNEVGTINSRIQQKEGVEIDVPELMKQLHMYESGFTNQALHRLWAAESGAMYDWYQDIVESYGGWVAFQGGYEMEMKSGEYSRIPTGHRAYWPEGVNPSNCMRDFAEKRGGTLMFKTALVKLIMEEGRVVGALARNEETGDYLRILSKKGVMVATGGYARNKEMMQALQPNSVKVSAFTCDNNVGDGIKACLWAGAAMDPVHTATIFDRCAIMPNETPSTVAGPGRPIELVAQPFLKVDLMGRRFANESAPYDFITHRALSLPHQTYCVVFDADFPTDTEKFECAACCRIHPFHNGAPAEHPIDVMEAALADMVEKGRFVKADTIEELAEKLGIPADTFAATVARYNELCDKGVDEDFGKEAHRMADLRKAPFYGVRACGFTLCTLDGIQIDTTMHALDENGLPIDGLYVLGCDSGSYFATTYTNLVTGACAGRNMTFAVHAVKDALDA